MDYKKVYRIMIEFNKSEWVNAEFSQEYIES